MFCSRSLAHQALQACACLEASLGELKHAESVFAVNWIDIPSCRTVCLKAPMQPHDTVRYTTVVYTAMRYTVVGYTAVGYTAVVYTAMGYTAVVYKEVAVADTV